MYARITLGSSKIDGRPGSLPSELVGLDDATLADLPAALNPVPGQFKGVGFWPVQIYPAEFDPARQTTTGELAFEVDAAAKRVDATPQIRDLTPEEIDARKPPVPESVTMRQAKLQLSRAKILAQANAIIAAIEGQAGEEARIEWESATSLRRDHPLVSALGRQLGLDDAAKDELFRKAAEIL